jgi:hypothetical protein
MGPNARRKRTIRAPFGGPDTKDLYREPSAPPLRELAKVLANYSTVAARRRREQAYMSVAERLAAYYANKYPDQG